MPGRTRRHIARHGPGPKSLSPYRRLKRLEAALGGKTTEVDAELAELYREYRYRRLMNASHEEYLDEPRKRVTWFFAIDNAQRQAESDAMKA